MGTHNQKFIIVHGSLWLDKVPVAHQLSMELFPDITSDIISFNGRNQFFVGSPADKEGCEFDPENLSKREKLFRACSSLDLGYIEVWDTEHSSWEIVRKSIECKYWESDERNIHTDPENEQS